ncbi:MAG: glycosyltransferase family 2 protein [Prevotella sp.]|nr:glycosyltransferase family 2 protein [Prevotella sp.]
MSDLCTLSILIPTYNDVCLDLVTSLQEEASSIPGLSFEIIVGDDGSSDTSALSANSKVDTLPHCRLLLRGKNVGRAAIRNFLAREAKGEWLLYVDSHMSVVRDDYISTYLSHCGEALVYGGYTLPLDGSRRNLRYLYECSCIYGQDVKVRQQSPYSNFHTSNFMVRREVMLTHPFDERFRRYGYEDVLFGKTMREAGITILHINNPVGFERFESNERFVAKTEEGLETLWTFRDELRGYSRLLSVSERLERWHVAWVFRLAHKVMGKTLRRHLTGKGPSLAGFKAYRLGCFLEKGGR